MAMNSIALNPQALLLTPLPRAGAAEAAAELGDFEALHTAYSLRIYRFLLASVRDRDLAETLTQDTFVRAWAARDQFRGDCSPATWLTRIALNLLRDHTRTNRFRFWKHTALTAVDAHDISTHLPHPASSAEAALIARQQVERVWQTVAKLSERQRTVFLLRFVEELELTDIAQITGMPLSTVKTHLYRSLASVRSQQSARSQQAAEKLPSASRKSTQRESQ